MSVARVPDHGDQAVALLISQFRGKPRIEIVLRALMAQVQELEDTAIDLNERGMDELSGYRLDVLGRVVGRQRLGMSDEQYRVWVKGRIAANRSSGRTEDILNLALVVFGEDVTARMVEDFPGAFTLHLDDPVPGDWGAQFVELIGIATAPGVRSQVTWTDSASAFRFSTTGSTVTDSDRGFGRAPLRAVGSS